MSRILRSLKSGRGTAYYCTYNNVVFRIGKVWASPFSRTPLSFGAPSRELLRLFTAILIVLETRIIDLHYAADSMGLSSFNLFPVTDTVYATVHKINKHSSCTWIVDNEGYGGRFRSCSRIKRRTDVLSRVLNGYLWNVQSTVPVRSLPW